MQKPQQALDEQNQRGGSRPHGKGSQQHRQIAEIQLVEQHHGDFHHEQHRRNGGQNGDGGQLTGRETFGFGLHTKNLLSVKIP